MVKRERYRFRPDLTKARETDMERQTGLPPQSTRRPMTSSIPHYNSRGSVTNTEVRPKGEWTASGLLYVAFGENNVQLPRVSYHMAEEGHRIRLRDAAKGDLLFFRTTRRAKRINHVGMVVAVDNNEIKFIHASSSRGVIVSSLREGYWNSAFVRATRVLETRVQ